jgi:23S rRNA (adenine2030-N6)-methyltransferase
MRQLFTALLGFLAASSDRRLQYEHRFHAGNYADVVKHSVLIELLIRMQQKKKPFCYVETHSGAGAYPLLSKESQKLAEHEQGVNLILTKDASIRNTDSSMHPSTEVLLELTKRHSEGEEPVYPGSPLVASSLCRSQDSLILCEKAQETFDSLRTRLGNDERVTLLNDNGYKALKRFENIKSQQRALVFIDPPYQMGSDTEQIVSLIKFLQSHWKSARIAVWHPVSAGNRERADRLYKQVLNAIDTTSNCLATELYDDSINHVGTGMLMVNPPFGIDQDLRDLLPPLANVLGGEASRPCIRIQQL